MKDLSCFGSYDGSNEQCIRCNDHDCIDYENEYKVKGIYINSDGMRVGFCPNCGKFITQRDNPVVCKLCNSIVRWTKIHDLVAEIRWRASGLNSPRKEEVYELLDKIVLETVQ